MTSTHNPGRVAGFLYLLLVVFAPFLGIVSDLFCGTMLTFLVLALYHLLKGVDQNLAVLMVILGDLLPATIDFFNVRNDAAALMLVQRRFLVRIRETSAGRPGHALGCTR